MTIEKALKTTFKVQTILTLLIGGAGSILISYIILTTSSKEEYMQIDSLLFGAFFGLIGIGAILALFILEPLEVYNDRLIIKSIFQNPKKTIFLKDINSYKEIKNGKLAELTIFTNTGSYYLTSSYIANYQQIKDALTQGKPRNVNAEKLYQRKTSKYFGIAFVIIGPLILLAFGNIYINKDKDVLPQQLSTIKATVLTEPETHKSSLNITVTEFPAFKFYLAGSNLKATNSHLFMTNISTKDTVEIDILTDDYEKKLTKTKPLSFWDKSFRYKSINIYGLRDANQSYLSLSNLNEEKKRDATHWSFWLFVILGLWVTSAGIYLLLTNK